LLKNKKMDIFALIFSKIPEMRILIVLIVLFGCMCACGGGKNKSEITEAVVVEVDSTITMEDSASDDEWIDEEPELPEKADESFDDFLYNFLVDSQLQITRIVFPLPYYTDDHKDSITNETWEYDQIFSGLESYAVLFDRQSDMELEKDTSQVSIKIDRRDMKSHRLKRYYFERIKGEWMLEAIDDAVISSADSESEDFFSFYERFVNDSLFQTERVVDPLPFVTIDPDDEFHVLETTLEKGQWFAFQPTLSKDVLAHIYYGQRLSENSSTRIMEFKGVGNGFYNVLYFQRRNGLWKLIKFEDLGD
jgi:hypothetical protein